MSKLHVTLNAASVDELITQAANVNMPMGTLATKVLEAFIALRAGYITPAAYARRISKL